MLILVAVTITIAVNGGLFEYARNAGARTNEVVKQEQTLASGRINVNNVWYDSIDAYIANTPSKVQGGEMPTKLTITGENIVEGKITLEVGDSITLGAKLDKGGITASDIEWNNSNNDALKVENGVITALNSTKGTAKITATFNTLVDVIEVTINPKIIGNCINCMQNEQARIYYAECPVCLYVHGPQLNKGIRDLTIVTAEYIKCESCGLKTYIDPDGPPPVEECPSCDGLCTMGEDWALKCCGSPISNSSELKWRWCANANCVDGKLYDFGN